MKTVKVFLLLLISINCIAQTKFSTLDECSLFDTLEYLAINNYNNSSYEKLKKDSVLRRDLLTTLEEYIVVFKSFTIAPMRLEKPGSKRSCPRLTTSYQALVDSNDLQSFFVKVSRKKLRKKVQKGLHENVEFLMLDLCGLLKKDKMVEVLISEFNHSLTLEFIYQAYKDNYVDPCFEQSTFTCLPKLIFENNLRMISERINLLDNKRYSYYESYHGKNDVIKGLEIFHDNDVLFFFPKEVNQDREYTGGFKFTFFTDYFKWRFIKLGKFPAKVLRYQSISIGGSGYTPYIRYRNNFNLADTLQLNDRPFGSYLYIERAKYRTWRKGLLRQKGEFQIGAIGLSSGRNVQAKLHEDVIQESQFVYGWDKQIGDGGRLVFQAYQKVDLLLFSTSNKYKTIFKPRSRFIDEQEKYWGHNLLLEVDLRLGGFYTSAGIGLRYSTLDLLEQSGTNQILPIPLTKSEFGWKFDFGMSYRYVQHNTMLEGLGYVNTFPKDQYDKVNPDYYVLSKDQIQRDLIIIDFGVHIRVRKTTLFFRQTFQTLEYESPLENLDFQDSNIIMTIDPNDIDFYNDKVVREQQSFLNKTWFNGKTYYGYGTLGISWLLD